jgi:hypothetical protein
VLAQVGELERALGAAQEREPVTGSAKDLAQEPVTDLVRAPALVVDSVQELAPAMGLAQELVQAPVTGLVKGPTQEVDLVQVPGVDWAQELGSVQGLEWGLVQGLVPDWVQVLEVCRSLPQSNCFPCY